LVALNVASIVPFVDRPDRDVSTTNFRVGRESAPRGDSTARARRAGYRSRLGWRLLSEQSATRQRRRAHTYAQFPALWVGMGLLRPRSAVERGEELTARTAEISRSRG
jgi:hypothetical protein